MKLKFKMMCILLILSVICSISCVVAMDDADMIAEETAQDDTNLLNENIEIPDETLNEDSTSYSFSDLADKIEKEEGSNITIDGTYKFDLSKDSSFIDGINIQKSSDFKIIGNNLIIDGNGLARAFNINSVGAVELHNITFINCYSNLNGGAIYTSSDIRIENCLFENNTAEMEGGAIYCILTDSSEFVSGIKYSNFTGNKAFNNYSAIYWKSVNNDTFLFDNFEHHSNLIPNQTIFKFDGNNSELLAISFINNTNKICFEVIGDNISIPGSKCYNNSGTVLKIIGDYASFGGNLYDNSMLDNDDFAIIVIGDHPYYGGVTVKSKKSLASYSNFIGLWGTSYTGDVICNGSVNAGGLSVGGNLVTYGNAYLAGCSINGNYTNYAGGTFYGLTVRETFYIYSDSLINGGFNKIYNNHSEIIFESSGTPVDMINDGGLVNFTYGSLKNSTFTNINGGKLISDVTEYECPTFAGCVFNNEKGEIDFNGNLLNSTDINNSNGNVNLENCTLINGSLINGNGAMYFNNVNLNDYHIEGNGQPLNIAGKNPSEFNNCEINGSLINNDGKLALYNTNITNCNITNKATLSIESATSIINSKLANYGDLKVSKDANVSGLIIDKLDAKLSSSKVTMYYGATKYVSIKVVDSNGNPIKNTKFTVTINKKTYQATSDANGAAKIKVPTLNVGSYTVTIKGENQYCNSIASIKTTVKVNKAKTTVKVAKTVKKSKKLKITVKSKVTKKAASKVKIKVKVYTGKKIKTYKIKTNKKGVAKLKTKKITKGKHKLVITSLNKNYKISKKIKIKVK